MFYVTCTVILLSVFHCGLSQAPGDHDEACRSDVNEAAHRFPMEWRILMDTYDYVNLFEGTTPPPVWSERDIDGNTTNNWEQLSEVCQRSMRTCTYESPPQNNWLFSQFIRYEDAVEVFFNTTFDFNECLLLAPACSRGYVTLYQYNRNGSESDIQRTNTSNYQPLLGSSESSRLQQSGETEAGQTLSLTRPSNSDGFYLGIRDEGTCGEVIRIIVYYVVCPHRVIGLVTYPETALPVRGSSDIIFSAVCAPNAHNITSLQVTASSTSDSCSDRAPGGARCECNEGYIISTDGMSCEGRYINFMHVFWKDFNTVIH